MSLTSASFRAVTIVLAVVAALAASLLWNRIRGPRSVRLAGRLGLLLAGELLTATAVLVTINIHYGGLIANWSDLLGNDSADGGHFTGQTGTAHTVPTAATRSGRVLTGHQRFMPAGAGGFVKTTLAGSASGITSDVYVWTPPQYAKDPGEDFPVLMLLHGVPGSPSGWLGPMNVVQHLQAAMATGRTHPYILVVPDIAPFPGDTFPYYNEECTDVPGGAKLGTWLDQDVRRMVLDNFRAIDSPSGWGLMGYSTGGFCAAKLVLQHPDLYRAAVALSGYYTPESRLLTGDLRLDRANSPLWIIGHGQTPAVSLLMTASAQDQVDPPSVVTQMVRTAMANPGSQATEVQSYIAPLDGGHNQTAWEKMLPIVLPWLSQRLSGPVA